MDPLPVSKPSPRLEGVRAVTCITRDSACLEVVCVCLWQPVMVVCLHPAGGCQKRFREDVGSDDRDLIKRMKGDFDTRFRVSAGSDHLDPPSSS